MTSTGTAASRPPATGGGVVAAVDPGSPADRAGVCPGDVVLSADDHVLHDTIDWQWYTAGEPRLELLLAHEGAAERSVLVEREPDTGWGIQFRDALFEPVRTCANDCIFCFVTQLPPGLRRSLYVRDDDFRLSFLEATFITLTNLSDDDVARIAEQRLSPLYVSLHAVSPAVRARLVCAADDDALQRFDELAEAGVGFHVQIVLVPGVNDGGELDATLRWLAARPGTLSVGVVPVGRTRHARTIDVSFEGADASRAVLDRLRPWQERKREEAGITWVQAADEFYLAAGFAVPAASDYDGFPQIENGIGLVRSFLDEAESLCRDLASAAAAAPPLTPPTLVTGEAFAPVLTDVLTRVGIGERLRVLAVPNTFLGGNVSVAGLLTAGDIAASIERDRDGDVYALPDVVLNSDGLTLDDATVDDLVDRTRADIRLVSSDAAGLLQALRAQDSSRDPRNEG